DAYIDAVSAAMKQEYEPIVAAGFVLQVDCPDLAMSSHTGFQELSEPEFLRQAEHQVEALNEALANVPADSVRMHICWGNYEGPHDHDIGLEKILAIILKAKPQAISFEASNPRHEHEWAVWAEAKIPDDKFLIPGVLDTLTNVVEHPELVAQRLCKFADIVGRERVIAGSDCGFGTAAGHGKLDPDISFKKLSAMVEGAAIASKRLWSTGARGTKARA
ncbi:MAG: epoxyalkane--coenzyme M transferase, partial [Alphaproteobacteria bacterium]|nr:epoxyalkane--coenzyme M transferase [Alphaproteobacteria bacterium]